MKTALRKIALILSLLTSVVLILKGQTITSLTLVNASTDTDIRILNNNAIIDLSVDGMSLNVRANTSGTVGSVKFTYDQPNIGSSGNLTTAIEGTAPYAMAGDQSGNYNSWTPSVGSHTLTVTAYSAANAGGTAGTPVTISFTVVNVGGTTGEGYNPPIKSGTGTVVQTGELKKWHAVTLSFDGPAYKENSVSPNPFKDFRLNVTFTNGTKKYVVPGYFAADGNAAETSSDSGNIWRVHFSPDATGTWSWTASFRIGENIAVSSATTAGLAVPPIDGKTGSFVISATDKTGTDLRGQGRLQYVGEHHLRFAETGKYFLKGGTDAPENFLAYEDFDNTPNNSGRRKTWAPHAGDWHIGDPSWKGGKGTEIIGAINYLASEGLNAFSFLTMNINGDDKNVYPYISASDFTHFDCSKLDQWEIVFAHGEKKGMFLHFKTQETENETLLDGGATSTNRKLYYRELIARFGHHMALNWNLGEENHDQTDQQRKDMAQYFYDTDPYHHPIVIHNYPAEDILIFTPLLGNNSKLTGVSIQKNWNAIYSSTKTWVTNSANAGKKWIVSNDEQGSANIGVPDDTYTGSPSIHDIRKETLWGNIMAGGAGVEYYFGYSLPQSDLTCQDFRSRNISWDFVRYALEFFKNNNIPYWQMKNDESLVSSGWCLAQEGNIYVVYLKAGGTANLTINTNATYNVKWYDPRKGGSLQNGTVTSVSGTGVKALGNAPSNTTEDWIVLITNANGINMAPVAKITADKASGTAPLNVNFSAAGTTDPDGSIASYSWNFGDGTKASGISASHVYSTAGTFIATLTATDDKGASATVNAIITVSGAGCGSHVEMMAKDFPLTGFYLDSYTGQQILAITPSTTPVTAITQKAFTGQSCTYNILFHGVGENDGQSKFKIYINNTSIGEYTLPLSASGYEYGTQYNLKVDGVKISNGDIIKVEATTGSKDNLEWSRARWLKIEFDPIGEPTAVNCEAPFEEKSGMVVVEVESVSPTGSWQLKATTTGYTGSGYYEWTGADNFNTPGSGLLEYKIKINTPGTYRFQWHNKVGQGTSTTDLNDSWLKIPDADDFYALKGTIVKYPKGGKFVQSTTIVNGASLNGWMKVYCSGTTAWTWSTNTSDNEGCQIYAKFNSAGIYTVQISARSAHHFIDRFVLYNAGVTSATATNKSNPETRCSGGSVNYTLIVNSGSGAGNYAAGTVVNISASAPVAGKVFDKWTGSTTGIANINSASTTIIMPATNTTITAAYKDASNTYTLTVTNGTGGGSYAAGVVVNISASAPVAGKVFDKWTGNTIGIVSLTSPTTSITITANATITATYKNVISAYLVTFKVTDGINAIQGADINFNGRSITTNVSGEAVFTNIPSGSLPFTVKSNGFDDNIGMITVAADVSKNIVLIKSPLEFNESEIKVSVYPNPATNLIHITSSETCERIQIYSATGIIIFDQIINAKETVVNLEGFMAGLYFLKITGEETTITKVLLKE